MKIPDGRAAVRDFCFWDPAGDMLSRQNVG
jgi:hypothetical protein